MKKMWWLVVVVAGGLSSQGYAQTFQQKLCNELRVPGVVHMVLDSRAKGGSFSIFSISPQPEKSFLSYLEKTSVTQHTEENIQMLRNKRNELQEEIVEWSLDRDLQNLSAEEKSQGMALDQSLKGLNHQLQQLEKEMEKYQLTSVSNQKTYFYYGQNEYVYQIGNLSEYTDASNPNDKKYGGWTYWSYDQDHQKDPNEPYDQDRWISPNAPLSQLKLQAGDILYFHFTTEKGEAPNPFDALKCGN
ncbi:MAG: hypothetical protein R3A11_01690 [Bdellovibrionota bacterium]